MNKTLTIRNSRNNRSFHCQCQNCYTMNKGRLDFLICKMNRLKTKQQKKKDRMHNKNLKIDKDEDYYLPVECEGTF